MKTNPFKIIILPTEKASKLFINNLTENLLIRVNYTDSGSRHAVNQHLYILDTEAKIEVGDWVFIEGADLVEKAFFDEKCDKLINGFAEYTVHKIIATTDQLEVNFHLLPDIPKQLVKEYVKEQFNYVPEKYICRKCGGLAIDSKALMNYHNIQHPYDGSKAEFETKLENVIKCSSCGHSWTNGSKDTIS